MSFKAIVPQKRWNTSSMQKELMQAIDDTTTVIIADFRAVTRTWTRQPAFKQVVAFKSGDQLIGAAGTDNEIFEYVTRGTKPHMIYPRQARMLRFQTGYRAKTTPRVIGSHAGGASGDYVVAKAVHHPGTEAREFEEEIAKRRQKNLENNVTAAILRARNK